MLAEPQPLPPSPAAPPPPAQVHRHSVPPRGAGATALTFAVARTRDALAALETDWNALFERAGRPHQVFQTFNWAWHWSRHFLSGPAVGAALCELYILTARREGRLILVWPMVRTRRGGIVTVRFLGDPVSQYGDLVVEPVADCDAVLDAAFDHLLAHARADAFVFTKVRADSSIATLLTRRRLDVIDRRPAPCLDLGSAPDFATYEQRYSTKARKNRRRLLRRFEERDPALLQTLEGGHRAAELASLALTLKRAWLRDRGLLSPALADPRTEKFFVDVARATERPVGCVVTSLETRGEAAAVEIAFDCKGHRAVHVIVYAMKFERASPGQLLIEQSVRNAFERGLKTYDLLAPADAYKLEWADRSVDVIDFARGQTALGSAYTRLYLQHGRPRLKAAANGAKQFVRRMSGARPALPDRTG